MMSHWDRHHSHLIPSNKHFRYGTHTVAHLCNGILCESRKKNQVSICTTTQENLKCMKYKRPEKRCTEYGHLYINFRDCELQTSGKEKTIVWDYQRTFEEHWELRISQSQTLCKCISLQTLQEPARGPSG